jgi:1-acyl-sn-glycerol-3-phosphate acyltransferase
MTDSERPSRTWLLPILSRVASTAVRAFYRFRVEGIRPPAEGPVLFVGNHPNSLVDPAFVAAAASRPVRFLAKAPLFTDNLVGWLIRASGSIPVYRRQDDPALMRRNVSVFEAVHEALEDGSAVGIFPEGISHSEPSLAELRTGAARISLGAAQRLGRSFPIIPIGMVLREKERFRSEAYALVGAQVSWDDLGGRPEDDAEAVRELTDRIDAALREVTLNLEHWEDLPVLECAEELYTAELDLERAPGDRVRRMRQMSEKLSSLRQSDPGRVEGLYRAIESFAATLSELGCSAADLDSDTRLRTASAWAIRRFALFLVGGPLAAAGAVVLFLPYRLTRMIAAKPDLDIDVRATWKILGGTVFYLVWMLLIALVVGLTFGRQWALAALVAFPLLAMVTYYVRDKWTDARADVRRYLALRRRRDLRSWLLEHRAELAESLERLRRYDG